MYTKAWMKKYELAKKYYEAHGNLIIAARFKTKDGINYDKDGYALGYWVIEQRQLHKTGVLPEDKKELLDKIGMVWNIFNAIWDEHYELAKKYYEKYGNLNVPADFRTKDGVNYDEKGFQLGRWIITIRSARRGVETLNLSEDQIKKLDELEIDWDPYSSAWNEKYELAKKFYEKYGHLNVPYNFKTFDGISHDENGININGWINMQRQAYKGQGTCKITAEQIKKLESIGMVWNAHENNWNENYELAKKYYKAHGNLVIPSGFKTFDGINHDENGTAIGVWIMTQRSYYDKLSKKRKSLLEKIGMTWENNVEAKWIINYNLAKKYYEAHGNLMIATDFRTKDGANYDKDGLKLGYWIVSQRRIYKGERRGTLTDKQMDMLNEIGMVWKVDLSKKSRKLCEDKWMENYKLAKNYRESHDNLDMPSNFRTKDGINYDENGKNLGSWIETQRKLYRVQNTYNLTDEHLKLLEEIDMIWFTEKINTKLQQELITNRTKNRKEKEILNRLKSYLFSLDGNTLPSKEEMNEGFAKKLRIK